MKTADIYIFKHAFSNNLIIIELELQKAKMKLMKLLIKIKACDIDRESTMGKENNTVCSNRMKIQNTNMITEEVPLISPPVIQ
jgi:hypothetical protein